MLKNYIKTAWRNLWKGRVFNTMNIVGLSVAIACCILLFMTVYFEFSFDKFHKNIDKIQQLALNSHRVDGNEVSTSFPSPFTPAIKAEFQDIRYITRLGNGGGVVRYNGKEIEKSLNYVDADFLKMFSFDVIKGNKAAPLASVNDVVMTEYCSKAIFGDADPVGKTIELNIGNKPRSFVVSGVVQDFPANSSIGFDMLIRFENVPDYTEKLKHWDWGDHSVFVQLNDNVDVATFDKRAQSFINKTFKETISNLKRDGAKPDAAGNVYTLELLPFANNHFNTELSGLEGASISKIYVLSLLVIGGFILAIACINFVNLSVARAFTRAREVGVRKTLGAGKWQLLGQFWVETLMVCVTALVIGIILVNVVMPGFKATFRSNISFSMLLEPINLATVAAMFIIITVVAGLYPALLMMRYKTVLVLKGTVNTTKPGKIRNVLLVTQFSLSTLLIICTLITWQQMNFMKNMPLGYNKNEVISIPIGHKLGGGKALDLLSNQLQGQPGVVSITGAFDNMGNGKDGSTRTSISGYNYKGHEVRSVVQYVSYDFLKTLDIKLLEGRDFSRDFSADSNAVIINEKMAQQLGGKDLLGSFLPMDDEHPSQVIGIVKNYNFRSLRENIMPLTLMLNNGSEINYIFVKVKPDNLVRSYNMIESKWKATFPNTEFTGSWINENTERQYRAEQRLSTIFVSGAIIAIVISCIGLLAISFMIMIQRTKEIGIRKVLGANVTGIVLLLSRDFMKMVLLAALIAFPLGWWVMSKWLQGFIYRIDIEWWIFAVATLMALVVAFVTVSFQSIRAALANPVKSLRSE